MKLAGFLFVAFRWMKLWIIKSWKDPRVLFGKFLNALRFWCDLLGSYFVSRRIEYIDFWKSFWKICLADRVPEDVPARFVWFLWWSLKFIWLYGKFNQWILSIRFEWFIILLRVLPSFVCQALGWASRWAWQVINHLLPTDCVNQRLTMCFLRKT